MCETKIGFFDSLSERRKNFELQNTDKNQIWTVKIYLKRLAVGKNTKTKYVMAALNVMAVLTPEGELLKGSTNNAVIGRYLRNHLDKHFKIEHIYKLEKIKFLGNSQIQIDT
jgi:hypothetical protein